MSGEDGEGETTFTIVTTDANEAFEPIHDRMPVILDADAPDEWLFDRPTKPSACSVSSSPPRRTG